LSAVLAGAGAELPRRAHHTTLQETGLLLAEKDGNLAMSHLPKPSISRLATGLIAKPQSRQYGADARRCLPWPSPW